MRKNRNALAALEIASPCQESWDAMKGDDRRRFCSRCRLSVYNLSGMSRKDAEELIRKSEGRICVRYYQRADGTVLTKDCPVGFRAARRKLLVLLGTGTAAGATLCSWTLAFIGGQKASLCRPGGPGILRSSSLREVEPFASVLNWLDPLPPKPSRTRRNGNVTMGKLMPRKP